MTGGRIKRLQPYIKKNENFMFTYGDGISNVNLKKLFKFFKKQNYGHCNSSRFPPGLVKLL